MYVLRQAPLHSVILLLVGCTRVEAPEPGLKVDALATETADPHGVEGDGRRQSAEPVPGTLSLTDRDHVDVLRVTAHVGAVSLRKRGGTWFTGGAGACAVSARRVDQALDNLAALESNPTGEVLGVGGRFELQIDAFAEERHVLHLELASRNDQGDLARLRDDSTVRIRGLDRSLWLPDPKAWCRAR